MVHFSWVQWPRGWPTSRLCLWYIICIYTHHTKLEEFMYYGDGASLTPAAVQTFCAGFANQCDLVLAPAAVISHDQQNPGVRPT